MMTAEDFLTALAKALKAAPEPARKDILAEVESHLGDVADRSGDAGVSNAIERFGAPDDYAARALEAHGLAAALAQPSPWQAVNAAMRYAGDSLIILTAAFAGFCLALFGVAFGGIALVDLIAPDHAGLFVQENGGWAFGVFSQADRADAHEVLGRWIIPISILGSAACFLLANLAVRLGVRSRLRRLTATA
jgi:uncharacterized membrane protein